MTGVFPGRELVPPCPDRSGRSRTPLSQSHSFFAEALGFWRSGENHPPQPSKTDGLVSSQNAYRNRPISCMEFCQRGNLRRLPGIDLSDAPEEENPNHAPRSTPRGERCCGDLSGRSSSRQIPAGRGAPSVNSAAHFSCAAGAQPRACGTASRRPTMRLVGRRVGEVIGAVQGFRYALSRALNRETSGVPSIMVSTPKSKSTRMEALSPSQQVRWLGCGYSRLTTGVPPTGVSVTAVRTRSSDRKAPAMDHGSGKVAGVIARRRPPDRTGCWPVGEGFRSGGTAGIATGRNSRRRWPHCGPVAAPWSWPSSIGWPTTLASC